MIHVVLFDIGGVVLESGEPTSPVHAPAYSAAFGLAPAMLRTAWFEPWHAFRIGAINEDEFWRQYFTAAGARNMDIVQAKALQRKLTVPVRDTLTLLNELKHQGKRLAALTNISHEWLTFQRQAFGLDQYFSPIIASCEIGVAKPEPAMYEQALKALTAPADSIVYIDNLSDNVAAAQKFGMRTIVYENPAQLRAALVPLL